MPSNSSLIMAALTRKRITHIRPRTKVVTNTGSVSYSFDLKSSLNSFLELPLIVTINAHISHWQKNARVVTIDSYENVPENDEKSLQKAVANQPVSVAIEAGGREFQHYKSVWVDVNPFYFFLSSAKTFIVVSIEKLQHAVLLKSLPR